MYLLCATHALALLGALSAQIPTLPCPPPYELCLVSFPRLIYQANGANAKPMAPTCAESTGGGGVSSVTLRVVRRESGGRWEGGGRTSSAGSSLLRRSVPCPGVTSVRPTTCWIGHERQTHNLLRCHERQAHNLLDPVRVLGSGFHPQKVMAEGSMGFRGHNLFVGGREDVNLRRLKYTR